MKSDILAEQQNMQQYETEYHAHDFIHGTTEETLYSVLHPTRFILYIYLDFTTCKIFWTLSNIQSSEI